MYLRARRWCSLYALITVRTKPLSSGVIFEKSTVCVPEKVLCRNSLHTPRVPHVAWSRSAGLFTGLPDFARDDAASRVVGHFERYGHGGTWEASGRKLEARVLGQPVNRYRSLSRTESDQIWYLPPSR